MALKVDSSTDHDQCSGGSSPNLDSSRSQVNRKWRTVAEMTFLIFLKEIVYIALNITKLPISVTFTLYFLRLVNELAECQVLSHPVEAIRHL